MTCPAVLRTDAALDAVDALRRVLPATARRLGRLLRADDAAGQFVRFLLVGGVSSVVHAVLFTLLSASAGAVTANVAGASVSSVLATELHRRRTFRAGARVRWVTAQWQGGAISLTGIVATTTALAAASAVVGPTGLGTQLLLVGAVTGAVGLARFAALRWAFARRPARGPAVGVRMFALRGNRAHA